MKKSKLIALSIVLALIFSLIVPITAVKADGSYEIFFTVDEGASSTHTIEVEGEYLKIDGGIVEVRDSNNQNIGVATSTGTNTAKITVSSGAEGELNFGGNAFSLYMDGQKYGFGTKISSNKNILVSDYQGGGAPTSNTVSIEFDNASISGNIATFNVDGTDVTLTVNGANISNNRVETDRNNLNDLSFVLNNYNDETMQVIIRGADNYSNVLNVTNNTASLNGLNFPDGGLHLSVEHKNGVNPGEGGHQGNADTSNYNGNATATLNYKVTGDIEYDEEMGTGVGFSINGITYKMDNQKAQFTEGPTYERDENGQLILDENNNPIPVKDPDTFEPMVKKTGVTITGDTIKYDNDASTNKVNFNFVTSWNTVIESIKINGNTVDNLPKTKEELASHYTHQAIEIPVNDVDNATSYDIEIEARMATENELYMGNFLWDYNPQGYTRQEDKILNATLTFVEAEYNGVTYTTEEQVNSLGNLYNWNDAQRKKKYTDVREGVGEAQFPTGTKLTVKIIPDAGYQLVDFGINGGVFEPQEEIGTYTFEITGGNFHLQATIAQVDDIVKTKSEKIASGSIKLGGTEDSMSIGTARLDVDDIELSKEQISNFEEAAEGYDIKNYVDISLFNTVFKGKETASWDTQVKDLDNEATITLKLEDGVDGNEVVIVHEKHDGTYEIIPVEYDSETHTITFKTKSFSNYAIASKTDSTSDTETETKNEEKNDTNNQDNKTENKTENTSKNPQTGDNIKIVVAILAVAMIGYVVASKNKSKRRIRKH